MPRTAKPRAGSSLVLSFAGGMLAIMLLVFGSLTVLYFSDLTLPGVQALGVDLGGKSGVQAANALQDAWQSQTIVIAVGSNSWNVTPNRLGLVLDADATVRAAQAQGRTGASLSGLWQRRTWSEVVPVWKFDRTAAQATLDSLAAQVHVPAQNPGLRIQDGVVEKTQGAAGQALNVQATLAWLEGHSEQTLASRRLTALVDSVPPAIADLGPAAAQATTMLAAPRSIRLYDALADERFTWEITPQEFGGWMALHLNPEDAQYLAWTFDQAQVEAYLRAQQSATLGDLRYVDMEEAVPALMKALAKGGPEVRLPVLHAARKYTVEAGETMATIGVKVGMPYPYIQQANPDVGDMLRVGQEITIPSPDVFLPLPPVENKRIVVSIAEQNVKVYEDGKLKWDWPASTGMASSPTSPGIFQVQSHDGTAYAPNWDLFMPFFMGIYKPVPGNPFMNGFHGFPSRKGSQILWTRNLGRPITYGCILLSTENEQKLYEWAEEGVVVVITP